MNSSISNSEKMGKMPIGKLLFVMSLPAMVSMFVQSLYNIVDSIYVSSIGTNAITALSIAFPIQMFMLGLATGIGIGSNSLIARRLGEKNRSSACETANNGLFMSFVLAAFVMVLGLLFSKTFISMFTDDGTVIEMGTQYLRVVTVFSLGFFVEIMLTKTLQGSGNMLIPMLSQLIGAVANIILDPILIFGYLGMPSMGVKGAAVATVISQFVAMGFTIFMFIKKSKDVRINFKGFKPNGEIIMNILKVGIPVFVINSMASVLMVILNSILKNLSEYGIPVLGIYFKLQSFVFMPVFGLTQGALPIMGYNYGALIKERFVKAFKLTLRVALGIMIFGTLLFQLFPQFLLSIFNAEPELVKVAIPALRIISINFIPAAFGIVVSTMFQALGEGMKSLIMTLTRQVGLLIPVAIILSNVIGVTGVWASYPIAEIVTVSAFFPLAIKTISKLFKKKEKEKQLLEATCHNVSSETVF